jgi:uncharacterized protein (TIGR02611 family)
MTQSPRTPLAQAKRVVVLVVGATIAITGVALLVLPGPGWLAIIAGLAILSTEFVWAERLLTKARQQAAKGASYVKASYGKARARRRRPAEN